MKILDEFKESFGSWLEFKFNSDNQAPFELISETLNTVFNKRCNFSKTDRNIARVMKVLKYHMEIIHNESN